jgi:histidinol-phosphate/aromatic aminotransferase/cobyric acid decarboxylase-like protein
MKPKNNQQKDFGLFEFGFDQNIEKTQLNSMVQLFPKEETIIKNVIGIRQKNGYIDMKRGELYPEIIGSVQRLKRTIAEAYGIENTQAQPNFACNGCIDTLMTYIKITHDNYILNNYKYNIRSDSIGMNELLDSNKNNKADIQKNNPEILVATPTYFRYYSACESKDIDLITIPLNTDYSYPHNVILDEINIRKPAALILCTPNNPTGIAIPDEILSLILNEVPNDVIIMIDRTCANTNFEIPSKKLLMKFKNKRLVIFHSFSKYYSMSHIRIGFSLFSNKEFANEVSKLLPFGLNLEGALKATKILSRGPIKPGRNILQRIIKNQELLFNFIKTNSNFSITHFTSNYALLLLLGKITSEEVDNVLKINGILIMPGHLTPENNNKIIRIHTGGYPSTTKKMLSVLKSNF